MSERSFGSQDDGLETGMIMEAVAEELKLEQSSPLATAMHAQASQQQQQQQQQQQSPTAAMHFSFSRTNSTGSVHAISCSSASSAHNTDDEDSDSTMKTSLSYKDRRREAHTHAEQKRRDAIKKGYDELQGLVPMCQSETISSQKLSKATILQKSIDYITFLTAEKKKKEEDLENQRKEVMALKIMKANYEHIVKANQNTPAHGKNQVSDEVKFQVFQQIMDTLFQSFNASVSVASFAELSACVFSWLEENCKPQSIEELTHTILHQVAQQMNP